MESCDDCGYRPVATVLTVYGIETLYKNWLNSNARVATVLTVYGIETMVSEVLMKPWFLVATVLTVYGIETAEKSLKMKKPKL